MNIDRIDLPKGINIRTAVKDGMTVYQVYVVDRFVMESRDPKLAIKQAKWIEKEKENGR